jgi:dTMP kinase
MSRTNSPHSTRGAFISLDGPDGGGKSTQAALLVQWLRSLGREVVACRDPGGTELGERLRSVLLERSSVPISLRTEMLLYMTSRAQLVDEIIRPTLGEGRCVVSDRYMLANVVYQGYAGGLAPEEIWRVGEVATGGLFPDLTVVIDVPPDVAHARVGAPRDRMEDRSDDFRERVRRGFFEAATNYPAPLVVIDGAADADSVAFRLRSEVARVLGIDPRS